MGSFLILQYISQYPHFQTFTNIYIYYIDYTIKIVQPLSTSYFITRDNTVKSSASSILLLLSSTDRSQGQNYDSSWIKPVFMCWRCITDRIHDTKFRKKITKFCHALCINKTSSQLWHAKHTTLNWSPKPWSHSPHTSQEIILLAPLHNASSIPVALLSLFCSEYFQWLSTLCQ